MSAHRPVTVQINGGGKSGTSSGEHSSHSSSASASPPHLEKDKASSTATKSLFVTFSFQNKVQLKKYIHLSFFEKGDQAQSKVQGKTESLISANQTSIDLSFSVDVHDNEMVS